MQLKLFTVRFDPRIEGFDGGPVQAFVRDKEVPSAPQVVVKDDTPYWTLLVTYNVPSRDGAPAGPAARPIGVPAGFRTAG